MNKLSKEVEEQIKTGNEMAVGQSGILSGGGYVYLPTFNGRQMMVVLTNTDPNNIASGVYVWDTAGCYIWGPGQIDMMQHVTIGPQDFQGHTLLIHNSNCNNPKVSYWLYAI